MHYALPLPAIRFRIADGQFHLHPLPKSRAIDQAEQRLPPRHRLTATHH